jgi:hypothetical protein
MFGWFGCVRRWTALKDISYNIFPNGWFLNFKEPGVEKEYCDHVSSGVYQQKGTLLKVINLMTVIAVLISLTRELLYTGWLLTPYELFEQLPETFFGSIIFNVVLILAPKQRSEHAVCGVVFMTLVAFLASNPLRTRRLGISSSHLSSYNTFWLRSCNAELVESSRDTLRICFGVSLHSIFHIFVHVRTKISFFIPVFLLLLSCLIFVPPLKLNDASNSFNNVMVFGVVSASQWFGSYRNELRDRLVWELQRRLDTSEQTDALLRLVFPAVVFVSSDGQITPSDALEEQFGFGISSLEDMPTQSLQENLRDDLGELVKEVRASRIPAKRKVMIRPRGGAQVFLCTACATAAKSDAGVRLGFDIHDTWESTSAAQAERRAFDEPGQVQAEAEPTDPRTFGAAEPAEGQDDRPRHNFLAKRLDLSEGQLESETSEATSDDEILSTSSVDESLFSEVSDSAQKRVSFQAAGNQPSSSLGHKKNRKERRAPMPRSFKIASSDFRYARASQAGRVAPVDFHTTAVDLMCRPALSVDGADISRELRVLLQCRHPNIVFVLGVAFDFPEGPVLVLERTWGSVSRALKNGPFGSRQAMRIADQVNSAVHYLRKLRMRHGAVGIDNVALLSSPRHTNVLAKLTNFAHATVLDNDQGASNEDIYACAVFTSNLFVDHHSKCVAFDDTIPKEQLYLMVSHNILIMRVQFHTLADLLKYIVSPDAIGEREIDNIFYDMHQLFQRYMLAKSDQGAIQQAPQGGEERLLQLLEDYDEYFPRLSMNHSL